MVIGSNTRLLIGETFSLTDLGSRELKGIADPVVVWRVAGESAAESRFDSAHPGALTQFVGRAPELELLRRAWQQGQSGIGQVVLISGEPGIGKSRLAEAARNLGRPKEGLETLAEALAPVENSGECYMVAELHRLQGELLLDQSPNDHGPAEGAFQQAIAVAQTQGAKSLELRTAMSLARLRRAQDRTAEAHDLLAPVYEWFTGGFDTADLKEAKALLDSLA